jgi:lipopolysaccharide assembly outer membrane protein LptD (OstA)
VFIRHLQKSNYNFTKIVFKTLRTNLFYIVFSLFFLTISNSSIYAQEIGKKAVNIPAKKRPDSTFVNINDLSKASANKQDTIKTKKPFLESKVKYKAVDYVKIDQRKKTVTLYNKAELYYTDVELKSGIIVLNYNKNEVYAGRLKDSLGKYTQYPNFKQGPSVVEPDSIRFNFKTKKALVWNSRTKQDEMNIKAEISKRQNDSVYFMKRARFTTAEDLDDPEYDFLTRKAKLVPGKKLVAGLTNLNIYGVPTPIALPFAFFPMSKDSRVSGIIMPTYADNNERGFSLQNGGYYFALSKKYDLAVLGDYYTNGGYALRFESQYANKYKFRGNFNFRFENIIGGERGFTGYSKTNSYNIQWSHSKDPKSNPNSSFTASVNFGSSKFYQNSYSLNYSGARLNNNLSSSISYTKRFNCVPQVNLGLNVNQSQNSQTQAINLTLPSLTLSVDRIFPFAKEGESKKGFFKNINLQYSMSGRNEIVTTDALFLTNEMFKDAKVGMQHSIPISTNFKIFKFFSATTSMNFNEVWYIKTFKKQFNSNTAVVDDIEVGGFDEFHTYSFSASLGTTVYGTVKLGDKKKLQAIRHVMRPSLSYSYTPSFEKYYDSYAIDATGKVRQEYTRFDKGIFGAPGKTMSNNIGFSLANTFEAKVRDKDSTKVEPKKIMLLNSLNLSTSYDITRDSLKLAPVQVSGGTAIFDQKLNINFGATLRPYALNARGDEVNKWNINNNGSLFRLSSANLTMNYSLKSKDKKETKKDSQNVQNGGREDDLFGRNNDLSNQRQSLFDKDKDKSKDKKPDEFFHTKTPWDLTFAYSLTYANARRENQIGSNSLMISGNIDLTPKWRFGVSTGYDLVNKGVTYTNIRMERDLMSWRMSFNWIPFGTYTSWGFFVGIKSSVLKDIKWEKNKTPDQSLR